VAEERRVLVVDDEPNLLHAVQLYLEDEGFTVLTATNGQDALQKARELLPNAIVMDVQMPGMDGFETLGELRKLSAAPVIMLTVRGEEADKVRGLRLGADDYVTKPFSQRELAERVRAVIRRAETPGAPPRTEIVVDHHLTIDFSKNEVLIDGQRQTLSPTEHRLLHQLVSNPGRVMTTESLLTRVWGPEYRGEDQYVRLYVSYLRQKLGARYILTEKGLGYRFVDFRAR